jgi:uncharacterized membrane protein
MDGGLLQQFKAWKAADDPAKPDFVEHLKVHSPWIFAHHPADACFREHVWKINGLYLCKGCLVTSAGFVVGIAVHFLTGWLSGIAEEKLAFVFVLLLLPTLVTGSFRWRREYRHGARFLLGFLIASALLLLFITERWEVRLVVIATFFVVQGVFEKKRRRQNEALLANCRK